MNEQDKAKVQQALEFLEIISPKFPPLVYTETDRKRDEAITTLRQLLEQPDGDKLSPTEAHTGKAPCARHCEATAFQIVIKNLKGDIERLKATPPAQPDDHGDELTIAYLDGVHTGKRLVKLDLTDDEIHALWWADKDHGDEWLNVLSTVRAVLAKIKEKSGGNHG
jgi:hypothetical protein